MEGKAFMEESDSENDFTPERTPYRTPAYTRTPTPNSMTMSNYASNPIIFPPDRKPAFHDDADKIFPLITEEVDSRLGTIIDPYP